MIQGHCTPLTQRHSVGKVARLGQGEKRHALDKRQETDRRKDGWTERMEGRTDGWTDRRITIGRLQSEALIKNWQS